MNLKKVGLYVVLGIAALLVARIVIQTVLAVVGFLWTVFTFAVTLAVVLGIAYGIYRAVGWLRDGGSNERSPAFEGTATRSTDSVDSVDPVDRVTEQYVEGDISEAELEAKLDDTLDEGGRDEIDRELDRS